MNATSPQLSPAPAPSAAPGLGPHYWPTPNPAFVEGASDRGVLQPTVSGELASARFGCVRNDGRRFHEGVDLKPVSRDARGEPLDEVFAFHDGVVRYANRDPSRSSYGRYVVVEHPDIGPGVVTLYAHLRRVDAEAGQTLSGGEPLGVMGRSAGGYAIPKSRAHLHFEVGLWLGPEFQRWYGLQKFETPNWHGAYNGLNVLGLDAWALLTALRDGRSSSARDFIDSQPVAVVAEGPWRRVPEALRIDPARLANPTLPDRLAGWSVAFSAEGWPLRWTALADHDRFDGTRVRVRVADPQAARRHPCLPLVEMGPDGPEPGPRLASLIGRLFLQPPGGAAAQR